MPTIGRYWRTVRHLKPVQVLARLQLVHRSVSGRRPPPPQRARCGTWQQPAARPARLVGPARLRILNAEYDLQRVGWDDPAVDRLARYNFHYFDDLNARDSPARAQEQRALIASWIELNPRGRGSGWEPYPLSLRVVNWTKWFVGGAAPSAQMLQSLATQVRWLRRRLEWHLLGNHLFANAKALVFAGLFFEGAEANEWLHRGCSILRRQLREQLLADGGHVERSPMYHALVLEDVLDLLNVFAAQAGPSTADKNLIAELEEAAGQMLYWLRCMTHPDGSYALFNDCAQGVAAALVELERYAGRLGVVGRYPSATGATHLSVSGYVRLTRGRAVALLDVAPVGPDYLPAHAHADTLSFELSLGRQRLIVNGGTSCYGNSTQRATERGTAAHSTVQVADANSSEVWGSFRVGRRARPQRIAISDREVCGSHDGYRFLPGRPEHRRCWRLETGVLTVEDRLFPGDQPAVARFPLAPLLRLVPTSERLWQVRADDSLIANVEVLDGHGHIVAATYAPEFGRRIAVDCLAVTLRGGSARVRWSWPDD